MTHSILEFIVSTTPYLRHLESRPGVDVKIMIQHVWAFSTSLDEINEDPTTYSNFRNLIAEYNRYLNLRLVINIEATPGYFSGQISQMMRTFMRIVVTSSKKSVPTAVLVGYMRSLNDFLDDFKNIDFLAMWFIKSDFFNPSIMEKVNNKLTDGGNCSYRVIDVERYVQLKQEQPIPPHYIIQIVSKLLEYIAICLDKQWQYVDAGLHEEQLQCTSLILDATRKLLMYLKEQPDYIDFETFKRESVAPFERLVQDCTTSSDLKVRSGQVSESFWFVRKMNEIGIDRAIEMFRNVNAGDVSDKLRACYYLYLRNYDEYIAKYRSAVADGKSLSKGLDEIRQVLGMRSIHFSTWTEEFKTTEIPVILAGVSSVWSILVSKDVSSSGKFLKPHCIQILCILRLLSVDLSKGAENHLAEVLTGQGKSVILGLLSAVLALTGHEVRVLCYSEYLSTRDENDFDEFFRIFLLAEKIKYGTFQGMTESFIYPVSNGKNISLEQLVREMILNRTIWSSEARVTPISKNTVLLIDEVDVFFTEKFYGNAYCPITSLFSEGLASLQESIWSRTNTNMGNSSEDIAKFIKKRIADDAAGNADMMDIRKFLDEHGTFPLLRMDKNNSMSCAMYTNLSLFDEQLLKMIDDARMVRDNSSAQCNYKMSSDDVIMLKDNITGIYDSKLRNGYRNIFNYFRLKGSNFDTKNFKNYGYLNLNIGKMSYARLPLQFPLILGVSGTLKNLGEYEQSGIEFYKIHNKSILPSFFGESNLCFNEAANFHYFMKEQDWLKKIYDTTDSLVESHRAVLIFFDSDVSMDKFLKEYKNKFDRLNEITENTSAGLRDKYIQEAGVSDTVTLATRGMGRGVDYKSSLSVEKNGGVHVIQTFYSVDVKEEVQIKGRTTRQDNKGSYELVICREHLVKDRIIPENDCELHTYHSMDPIRRELSAKKGETAKAKIEECERNHNNTMKFFKLV